MKTTASRGFSVIELLVVIVVLSILTAILLPALGRARDSARSAACKNNLKQIGHALNMHLQDNALMMPTQRINTDARVADFMASTDPAYLRDLAIHLDNTQVYICPSAPPHPQSSDGPTAASDTSYLGNGVVMNRRFSAITNPGSVIFIQEYSHRTNFCYLRPNGTSLGGDTGNLYESWKWDNAPADFSYSGRHANGGNLLFLDGRVDWKTRDEIEGGDFGLTPDDGTDAGPYTALF